MNNKKVISTDLSSIISETNNLIENEQKQLGIYLSRENDIRKKYNLEKVDRVTPINKLPIVNKKCGLKLLKNSQKYFIKLAKIDSYKKKIENLNVTKSIQSATLQQTQVFRSDKHNIEIMSDTYISQVNPATLKIKAKKEITDVNVIKKRVQRLEKKYLSNLKHINNKIQKITSKYNLQEKISINDLEVVDCYNVTDKKEKKVKTKKCKEILKLAKLLYKRECILAKQQINSNHVERFLKFKDKLTNIINGEELDSLLCFPNTDYRNFIKKNKVLKYDYVIKKRNETAESDVKELINRSTGDVSKIEAKLIKKKSILEDNISKSKEKIANYKLRDNKYHNLVLSLEHQNEKLKEIENDINLCNKGISPKFQKKISHIQQENKKINKQLERKKTNASSSTHNIERLLGLLSQYKSSVIGIFVVIIFATVLQISVPILMNFAFDTQNMTKFFIIGNNGLIQSLNYEYTFSIFGLFAAVYFLIFVFNFFTEFIASKLGGLLSYNLRQKIKFKIDKLPLSFFDSHSVGDLIAIVNSDIDLIASSIHTIISQTLKSVFLLVGVIIAMFIVSPQLCLIAIASLPFALLIVFLVALKSQKEFIRVQHVTGKLNGQIEEVYSGYNVVKLFNQEDKVNEKFAVRNIDLQKSSLISQFYSGCIQPLLNMVHNICYVFICIVAGILGNVGSIVSFMAFLNLFQQPIQQTAQISNVFQQTMAASTRVFEILDSVEEVKDTEESLEVNDCKGYVDFEDVFFSYTPDKPLIEHMNLSVKPGDSIAIVGPTGAGKTTLVNLIMRFYDVTSGSLKIDGKDIREYKRNDIRKQIGMVLQDTWLFNGTISENIAYGRKNATMDEIIEASKKARAHHFIQTLEHGYDTVLTEDANNVSQGQKQLITIARAILSNPNILILDEATSSVDTRTEKALQDAMNEMMIGRTSFVIAHRLSTIKNSKLIIVMDKGHIVEQGNHEELIAKKGFYYNLYNSQFLAQVSEE